MLHADKRALERELGLSMNELRQKEIAYLRSSFQVLATASSVLVGFGFQGLSVILPKLEPTTGSWAYSRFAVTNWQNLTY